MAVEKSRCLVARRVHPTSVTRNWYVSADGSIDTQETEPALGYPNGFLINALTRLGTRPQRMAVSNNTSNYGHELATWKPSLEVVGAVPTYPSGYGNSDLGFLSDPYISTYDGNVLWRASRNSTLAQTVLLKKVGSDWEKWPDTGGIVSEYSTDEIGSVSHIDTRGDGVMLATSGEHNVVKIDIAAGTYTGAIDPIWYQEHIENYPPLPGTSGSFRSVYLRTPLYVGNEIILVKLNASAPNDPPGAPGETPETDGIWKFSAVDGSVISGPHQFGFSFGSYNVGSRIWRIVRDQMGKYWFMRYMATFLAPFGAKLQVAQFDPSTMSITAGPFNIPLNAESSYFRGGPTLVPAAAGWHIGHVMVQ